MQAATHNNFDAIRLFAALLVLAGHQFLLGGLVEPRIYGLYSLGDLGVAIFFSISGFLVARSWADDPSPPRFAARRILRIWPALAVNVLLTAFVLGPLVTTLSFAGYFSHPQFLAWLGNLILPTRWELPVTFLPGRLEHTVNGSLWTIALESACYVGFVVASLLTLMRRPLFALAFIAIACAYYLGWLTPANWPEHPLHRHALKLEFVSYFVAGALWLQYRDAFAVQHRVAIGLVAVVAIHLLAVAAGKPLFALWISVPFAVVALGLRSTPVLRHAGRFGDLSYGIYLYAFPVQQTLIWLWQGSLPFWLLLLTCAATSATLAFASWHLVEKKALLLKPRRRRVLSG